MKREIFNRNTRFTHRFGKSERMDDPMGSGTFDPEFPLFPDLRSKPLEIQTHGVHSYREPRSAIQKPNGQDASLNGQARDLEGMFACPIPANTKKRTS